MLEEISASLDEQLKFGPRQLQPPVTFLDGIARHLARVDHSQSGASGRAISQRPAWLNQG
jgi:hypothetical protein